MKLVLALLLAGCTSAVGCLSNRMGATFAKLQFAASASLLDSLPPEAYSPHFLEDDHASEKWQYLFYFPNGYILRSLFQITNLGPGQGRGFGLGTIITPEGRVIRFKNSRPQERWTYTSGASWLEIKIARHVFSWAPPDYRVRMKHNSGTFEIEAQGMTPIYRPGRTRFSEKKFYDLTVLAPRLKVRGTVQLPGEPVIDLGEGWGIGSYAYGNIAEHHQAVSWLRFDTFDKDVQLSLLEFTTPERFEHQRVGLLLVIRQNRIVHHSYGYVRSYTGYTQDQKKPHYPIPLGFSFSNSGNGSSVTGEVKLRPIDRYDVLTDVDSSLVRFLLRQISRPMQYQFHGDYTFTFNHDEESRTLSGTGFAEVSILNPPPEGF